MKKEKTAAERRKELATLLFCQSNHPDLAIATSRLIRVVTSRFYLAE